MEHGSRNRRNDPSLLSKHKAAVSNLSKQIADFHNQGIPFRIYHGTTNSTRPSVRTRAATVDISSLRNVVSISVAKQTCLVEPNVPMDALVAATLPYGLVPPVVPEFPGITVGGGYAGTAGESSSFKHGFFDRAVEWIEVILADGEVVDASECERQDLFHGMPGTFGTLGVTTLFEVRLIPAKRYVELSYLPVSDIRHAQQVLKQVMDGGVGETDFLDGIMFARDAGVVMSGRFAERDEKNEHLPIVTFTKPWDQWFYLHAEERMKQQQQIDVDRSMADTQNQRHDFPLRDLIPLTDYLFRYDRGAFWTGRYAFTYFLTPFNRFFRWLGDRYMHTRIMYHALHRSGLMQRFIIQDMALPDANVPEFSAWLDAELPHIYPRWLCPLKLHGSNGNMHPHVPASAEPHLADDMLLNIGVWGPTPPNMRQVTVNRRIEAKLRSLHGMKWLYAQTFYTEDEFWEIYDRKWYDALRAKYRAQRLPSVYEKVGPKFDVGPHSQTAGDVRLGIEKGLWSLWPAAGVYGVLSAIKGGDYLRKG